MFLACFTYMQISKEFKLISSELEGQKLWPLLGEQKHFSEIQKYKEIFGLKHLLKTSQLKKKHKCHKTRRWLKVGHYEVCFSV